MLSEQYREEGMKVALRLFAPEWKAFGVPIQGEALNRTVAEALADPAS